jgi:hypothetical protein
MNTTKRYLEIKDYYPPMTGCFYAFSNDQFDAGRIEAGIAQDEKVYSAGAGLYGTKEGITGYLNGIRKNRDRIAIECNPQDVYDCEFDNHECGYVGDDAEAIRRVAAYFAKDAVMSVKRRHAYVSLDGLYKR